MNSVKSSIRIVNSEKFGNDLRFIVKDVIIKTSSDTIKDIVSRTGGVNDILKNKTREKLNIKRGGYSNTGYAYGELKKSINFSNGKVVKEKLSDAYRTTIGFNLNMNHYGFAIAEVKYKFGVGVDTLANWIITKITRLGHTGEFYYFKKTKEGYEKVDVSTPEEAKIAATSIIVRRNISKKTVTNAMYKWYDLTDSDTSVIQARVKSNLNLVFAKKFNNNISKIK